jgi:hypothetical protein
MMNIFFMFEFKFNIVHPSFPLLLTFKLCSLFLTVFCTYSHALLVIVFYFHSSKLPTQVFIFVHTSFKYCSLIVNDKFSLMFYLIFFLLALFLIIWFLLTCWKVKPIPKVEPIVMHQ